MKYFTFIEKMEVEAFCTWSYIDTLGADWLLMGTSSAPSMNLGTSNNTVTHMNRNSCEQDDIKITRRYSLGGPIFVDEHCIFGALKSNVFDMMKICLDAISSFGVSAQVSGNDILVDGKKIAGFAGHVTDSGQKVSLFVINTNTDLSNFVKYIAPDPQKIQRYGDSYTYTRVGKLSDYIPDITPAIFAKAVQNIYADALERTADDIIQYPEFQKNIAMFRSKEWIYHGLKPEEVFILQNIIFGNTQTLAVEAVKDGIVAGREVLVFEIPEQPNISFENLKEIFINKAATQTIVVTYKDSMENDAEIKQNLQLDYSIPVSLSYESGKYIMTLGKMTPQEKEYQVLLDRVSQLER